MLKKMIDGVQSRAEEEEEREHRCALDSLMIPNRYCQKFYENRRGKYGTTEVTEVYLGKTQILYVLFINKMLYALMV